MITDRWMEESEQGTGLNRIENAIYRVDSQAFMGKMKDLEKEGWKINKNYCIDEKNGQPVRYYLMKRQVVKPAEWKKSLSTQIVTMTRTAGTYLRICIRKHRYVYKKEG